MPSFDQIHPIAVHFPIVFLLTLAAFDTIVLLRGHGLGSRSTIASVSAGLAVLAGLGAAVAYYFGDAAYDVAMAKGYPAAPLDLHAWLGTATASILGIWALLRAWLWWQASPLKGRRAGTLAGVEVAVALLIVVTAYYGGHLVYDLGVNISPQAAKAAIAHAAKDLPS